MAWTNGDKLQGGKYVIEKVLGEGGFGITYRALHIALNQPVVIKTPNGKLQNHREYPKFVKRFLKEGQILAKLGQERHPHIVRVRDLFVENELPCLAMDYIAGENLFELVERQGKLPETEAVEYITQIGNALILVHNLGIVHRDAHPGNIMLPKAGEAVLIDFGIAGEILPSTFTNTHHANRAFAPYEQMKGSREPTVDIYTLGASLYYAVTGQLPAFALDRKFNKAKLILPKEHNLSLSNEINRAIIKAMELEAKHRPKTMKAWLNTLQSQTTPMQVNEAALTFKFPLRRALAGVAVLGVLGLMMFRLSSQIPAPSPSYPIPVASLIVISPQFEDASGFANGLALVKVGSKYGYIDKSGKQVISSQFDDAWDFADGLALVKVGSKHGYIDKSGKQVISPQFDDVYGFADGLARLKVGSKHGYIDKSGKQVISPQFDDVRSFADGLALVKVASKYGYIDKSGKQVISPQFDYARSFADGLALVKVGSKYGYIDKNGKQLISPQFDYAWDFADRLARVKVGSKWGYIDKSGRQVISPQFSDVYDFADGLALVKVGSKWGYIDKSGRQVISPQFDYAEYFADGLAAVKINGKLGYIRNPLK
jgi:serine/threonine protein kinase